MPNSDLAAWKVAATDEAHLRKLVTAPPASIATYEAIRRDPARKSDILARRLNALFELFGIAPDASGYRRLLFAVLSSEEVATKLTGLRQPRRRRSAGGNDEARTPPAHMVAPLRTLAALVENGHSKAAAIRYAVDEQNHIARHLDQIDPRSRPRRQITVHALKAEEQRTRRHGKIVPGADEDPGLANALDFSCWASALEASAPRSDPWVEDVSRQLANYRRGGGDRATCRSRILSLIEAELDRADAERSGAEQ